jgi:hypothetical protein
MTDYNFDLATPVIFLASLSAGSVAVAIAALCGATLLVSASVGVGVFLACRGALRRWLA